jgi:hypothetical protein
MNEELKSTFEEFMKSCGDVECPYCHGLFYLDRPIEDALTAERDVLKKQLEIAMEAMRQIKELATYDIDNEEDGNTYQVEAIAQNALAEIEKVGNSSPNDNSDEK